MLSERSESLDTKSNATEAGKKDELRSQNSVPATSVSKAVSMRECLRSLRRHQKVMISMENVWLIYWWTILLKSYQSWSLQNVTIARLTCFHAPNCSISGFKDDSDKVRTAYRTLFIYVRNVAKNPDEEKFRKIRLSNPLFQVNFLILYVDYVMNS